MVGCLRGAWKQVVTSEQNCSHGRRSQGGQIQIIKSLTTYWLNFSVLADKNLKNDKKKQKNLPTLVVAAFSFPPCFHLQLAKPNPFT
jgi:hypothetical protein